VSAFFVIKAFSFFHLGGIVKVYREETLQVYKSISILFLEALSYHLIVEQAVEVLILPSQSGVLNCHLHLVKNRELAS